ncbi:MFS transporter [Palleronia abyssalis]|uniref:Putative sulfoacetate transporter SauU n=1 Tax=Palleronia abyssalis TaxID=1501240 RepID=A0A2R8C0N1_9RHOB|nr:MFS transporter [Palleronia abyssalis]SPJ25991.1 putative sulfoacetate transporter SauU [Palleronia abyssalis]
MAEGRWGALTILCAGVVGVLATWFSATAILPELTRLWALSPSQGAWLTNGVQIGFVAGALGASLVNLPDIVRMQRLMAVSSGVAALANLGLLVAGPEAAIALRILTGIALAGVYPPALKLMATWFVRGRGLALGLLIGALTLGSSLPHLIRAVTEGVDWRAVVWASSGTAAVGAILFAVALKEGPHAFARAVFDPRKAAQVFTRKPLMLANLGYFGHMWELYAMWAWILAFASAAREVPFGTPSTLSFIVVASGAVGCVLGGVLSDRIGRCWTTAGFMAVSGSCALLIGLAFDGPAWMFGLIALVWGMSVIGDSAQFSAAVTELADPAFVGTALALQLGIGFALTVVAIWIVPVIAALFGGWQWAFLILVPGPVIGTWAMLRLRRMPEAVALAGGAR